MDVLVLGNGFDLAHILPTTYLSFLKTTEFIAKQYSFQSSTIGQVFAAIKDECEEIQRSYNAYKSVYDKHALSKDALFNLKKMCDENEWWQYFKKTYNKSVGWIDFEKEIAAVIEKINRFIDKNEQYKSISKSNLIGAGSIALHFDFFTEPLSQLYSQVEYNGFMIYECHYRFKSEYITQQSDDKTKTIDRRKIALQLYDKLQRFSELLKQYFILFVEEPMEELAQDNLLKTTEAYRSYKSIITYNYTNTFETIYETENVAHIHGNTNSEIVLGINPDDNDETNGDISFIDFKKYYQRVVKETDIPFLRTLKAMKQSKRIGETTLSIIGHSLDVTDKDSLNELFEASNRVFIYYHERDKVPEFMQKLIKIFGKTRFDELRYNQHLRFLPLEDFTAPNNLYEID